jgi:hypothetical protein
MKTHTSTLKDKHLLLMHRHTLEPAVLKQRLTRPIPGGNSKCCPHRCPANDPPMGVITSRGGSSKSLSQKDIGKLERQNATTKTHQHHASVRLCICGNPLQAHVMLQGEDAHNAMVAVHVNCPHCPHLPTLQQRRMSAVQSFTSKSLPTVSEMQTSRRSYLSSKHSFEASMCLRLAFRP